MARDENETTGIRAVLTGIFTGDRRKGADRRNLTLESILRGSVRARRRDDRRSDDINHLDWHQPHLLFLSVAILLLSVVDAVLTLTLLRHGGTEANPFLDHVLTEYPELFAIIKMALTGLGVLILVALARVSLFRVVRATTLLHWCLLAYVGLIVYELWLLRGVF